MGQSVISSGKFMIFWSDEVYDIGVMNYVTA